MVYFDNSCDEICNSKAFVDITTAGRRRSLSTIYIKHNFFHQSKLGRDVELPNPHIVLFKSPRDVMQITTLSTQLGLGSELVDWFRDATSVPLWSFVDCFVDTRRRSITLLYKHRIQSLKTIYPGPAETVKNFGRCTHKISLFSKCSNHFPTNAKIFSFNLDQKNLSCFSANA